MTLLTHPLWNEQREVRCDVTVRLVCYAMIGLRVKWWTSSARSRDAASSSSSLPAAAAVSWKNRAELMSDDVDSSDRAAWTAWWHHACSDGRQHSDHDTIGVDTAADLSTHCRRVGHLAWRANTPRAEATWLTVWPSQQLYWCAQQRERTERVSNISALKSS